MASGKHTLDSLTANHEWVDALLALFWAVDRCCELGNRQHVPVNILEAYDAAEKARKGL